MTDLGRLVGTGRTAEVYAAGEGRVVKLLRPGFPDELAEAEARTAAIVASVYPAAPRCDGIVTLDGRLGIAYERVDGPSMDARLRSHLWELDRRARELGELHAAMHRADGTGLSSQRSAFHAAIERARPSLAAEAVFAARRRVDRLAGGTSVCHGDLHPGNVLIGDRLVVIDWDNASCGSPAADVARAVFLIREASASRSDGLLAPIAPAIRRRFAHVYLAAYARERPIDPAEVAAWRLPVLVARLAEGIADERTWIQREVEREVAPEIGRGAGRGP